MILTNNLNRKKEKEAFTIIEIMIVIMIGGLLILMGLGARQWYQRARVQANDQKLANIDAVIELYSQRIGQYPQDLNDLIEGPQKPALRKKWATAMAKESDLKDAWNKEFMYELLPKGSYPPYELYSTGPTGQERIYSPASQE